MNVCIVGNGPSVFGSNYGPIIDQMDVVIRIHEWKGEYKEDFGTKYNYGILPGPWIAKAINQITITPTDGWLSYYFKVQKSRDPCPDFVVGKKTYIFNETIDSFFSEILKRKLAPTRGLCAVYMAALFLKPKIIYLAGFDSVMAGLCVQYHDLTGQKLAEQFVGKEVEERHDFAYERRMIERIQDQTGIEIKDIKEWI